MPRSPKSPKRDAQSTKSAILKAAQALFTRAGFEGVGIRDIAEQAGVNGALVIRYFGSKEALFERAVATDFDLSALLQGERTEVGRVLARYVLEKKPSDEHDPLLALLRSAPNAHAATILRRTLDESFSDPLARWLGGEGAKERAALIAATLVGVLVSRNVIGSNALRSEGEDMLETLLAATLQDYIDGQGL